MKKALSIFVFILVYGGIGISALMENYTVSIALITVVLLMQSLIFNALITSNIISNDDMKKSISDISQIARIIAQKAADEEKAARDKLN